MDQKEILKGLRDLGIQIGKRTNGQIKRPCPKCSPTRRKKGDPCLSVNLDKGHWLCHHCGWKGGLTRSEEGEQRSAQVKFTFDYPLPDFNPAEWPLDDEVIEMFEERGISETTLRYYKIGSGTEYMPQTQQEEFVISIPNYVDGYVVNVKYRGVDEKIFKQTKDCQRTFYGLDDLFDEDTGALKYENVFIVEGEVDKWSCTEAGYYNVLSVPDGAPSPETKSSEKKFEYLESPAIVDLLSKIKTVTIAVDGDPAGQALAAELSRRIGVERCFQVFWPEDCKDANDVLVHDGPDALVKVLEGRKPYPVEGVITVNDLSAEVFRRFEGLEPIKQYTFGYGEGFDRVCRLVGGQLWTVTGPPNSGKSAFLAASINNVVTENPDDDFKVGWFTPESWPLWKHIRLLTQLRIGKPFGLPDQPDRMSRRELDTAMKWIKQHHFYLSPEDTSVDGVLRLARAMVLQNGIRILVLDPYNRFYHDFGKLSETNYVNQFCDKLAKFAQRNGCDVFLVAHPKKLDKYADNHQFEGRYRVASAYDISGSAHFFNISDNILSIWRDPQNLDLPVQCHIQKGRDLDQVQTGVCAQFKFDRRTGRYTYLNNNFDKLDWDTSNAE